MNLELENLAKEKGIKIIVADTAGTEPISHLIGNIPKGQQVLIVSEDPCPKIPFKKIELPPIIVHPIFEPLSGRENRRNKRKHKSKRVKNKKPWK